MAKLLEKKKTAKRIGVAAAVAAAAAAVKKHGLGERFWKEALSLSLWRQIILVLSLLFFIYAILPVLFGTFPVGSIPMICIAVFVFLVTLKWDSIVNETRIGLRILYIFVAVLVCAGTVLMSVVAGMMTAASMRTVPEEKTRVTVVVLGCLIYDDRPSNMLRDRLDKAYEYLESNPEAYCVVSGGQGENEKYPEALVMKDYLVKKGISETRIVMEDKSTSTLENITFSKEVMEKYNCYEDIVIVTDRFHQYRAHMAAEEAGLTSYALNVETRWYLFPHYWLREIVGIVYIALFGNR